MTDDARQRQRRRGDRALDQLLAGAGPDGVTYDRALALLGVTDITVPWQTLVTATVLYVVLPLVASATKIVYGQDMLAGLPVKDYLKRIGERPAVQQVNADRKTNTEAMMARMKAKA